MSKKNNIIEINGKRYDAVTGQALSHHGPATKPADKPAKRRNVDGIIRQPAKPAAGRKPKTTHTLMRQAVKKPAAPKHAIKTKGQVPARRPAAKLELPKSIASVDQRRLLHAKRVAQSRQISHFIPPPMIDPSQLAVKIPPPPPPAAPKAHAHQPKKPQTTADILEIALHGATSHLEPKPKVRRRHKAKHRLRTAAAAAVVVVSIGALASLQLPDLRIRLASARAGVDATMPDHQPAGYSLSKITYSTGSISTRFNSNSDERAYTLTRQQSTWDSAALRDQFVAPTYHHYQAVQTGGRTVYLYGEGNATWVSGDIWYQLQSNGSLSQRQLLDLVASL